MENKLCIDEAAVASSLEFDKDQILRIIIGFGGRMCLEKSLSNGQPTLRVLVWEPDSQTVESYCENTDISDLMSDKRLIMVVGNDTEKLKTALKNCLASHNIHHLKIVTLGKYAVAGNPDVESVREILRELMQPIANAEGARKKFHMLPCKNLIYTVCSLNKNYVISQLFEKIITRDIPVIIVAAGPSLMNNYMELKRAKGRTIIIAVTHAMKTLNQGGIVPDLVALTDPGKSGYLDFDKEKKYTLLSCVHADDECRKGYDGKIVYYGFNMFCDEFAVKRTLMEENSELDTGSVATDVFSLFVTAGFTRIILVGQDLAYDDSGFSHTGSETDNTTPDMNGNDLFTEGVFKKKIRTREDWEFFRAFYEKVIRERSDINVIDATEGGALIHGTEIMPLSEAIERYCYTEYPIKEWIEGLEQGNEEEKNQIEQWINLAITNLDRMKELLCEAVMTNRYIMRLWNDTSLWDDDFRASCRKYDVLYKQIMDGVSGGLLRLYCTKQIQFYVENALATEGDDNTEKRMKMEEELFVKMEEMAVDLLKYINNLANTQ